MINNETEFHEWLNNQLNLEIPSDIIAFNINIYQSPFFIEIVGSTEFDKQDEDWACNEDWIPKERRIEVSESIYGSSWEDAQVNISNMAKSFLKSNLSNVEKIKNAAGFAVGFVDGNLEYIK